MKQKIGITIGDLNGIGLEVILKTLSDEKMLAFCTPVIYGSSKVVSYHKNIVQVEFQYVPIRHASEVQEGKINVVNCWQENVNITLGKLSDQSGKYAAEALAAATEDLKNGLIDCLVTAPINKKAMEMADFPFPGHTEYLTEALGATESVMLMVADDLRVGLVTNHLPLHKVAENVTRERILQKIQILHKTLRVDFGIEKPTIAVLGLNPHAGDDGALGSEEIDIIRPAIEDAKAKGILAMGPYAADGFFGSSQFAKFDAILAMYHDQGLVPFKAISFGAGVNFTAGLSAVRTSPDHGTGYDIAGQNVADPSSFRRAMFLALDLSRNRAEYTEDHANQLRPQDRRKKFRTFADDYAE
jgi:4-phospho-D-threonate 3-dehydrogenase / 4-phospho-D-erythronate 3-dehydrogenase